MSNKKHHGIVHRVNNVKVYSGRFHPNGVLAISDSLSVPTGLFTAAYGGATGYFNVTLDTPYKDILTARAGVIGGTASVAFVVNVEQYSVDPSGVATLDLQVYNDLGAGAGLVPANIAAGSGDICFWVEFLDGVQG